MGQSERNDNPGSTGRKPTSSPPSTWISLGSKTSKDSQTASYKVRSQAAKASAKARLQTMSQRSVCRDPAKGRMVWTLPLQPASFGHQSQHFEDVSKDRSSLFGLLRRTKHMEPQVIQVPRQVPPPIGPELPNFFDGLSLRNDFTHLIRHCKLHFSLPCIDADCASSGTFRT